ncbi:MAG: hypothetical protein CMJ76_11575 [Planctomycetaceae bacterium]|nr:hypothetical protein [Planctomycetaceae bacterium]
MANSLSSFFDQVKTLSKSKARPERAFRDLVRNLRDVILVGEITVERLAKTTNYTPVRELRDGKTVGVLIANPRYELEIQTTADCAATVGKPLNVALAINKFDGYSKTFYAYETHRHEDHNTLTNLTDPEVKQPNSDDNPVTEAQRSHSPSAQEDDPLAVFQAEALAILSSGNIEITNDISAEEDLLSQLQRQAEDDLQEMHLDVDDSILGNTEQILTDDNPIVSPPAIPTTIHQAEHTASTVESKDAQDPTPVIPTATPREEPSVSEAVDKNSEQVEPQPVKPIKVDAPEKAPKQTAPESTKQTIADDTLDTLLADALGDSAKPVTIELLSAIVSLQTGLPLNTVSQIQKSMWQQISTPETFGDGKKNYKFPLLGKFTVRKHDDDISLDFTSTDVKTISAAKVNDTISFHKAREHYRKKSGPLIARHAVGLAVSTAAVLGLKQAHSYLTIYRTILLLLRIIGKGERRVRIEDVGEFFPTIVTGSTAYRFRAYPTLLRATSSAFKDASVFLAKPGEAQERFDKPLPQTAPEKNDNSSALGCLIFLAIMIGVALLTGR